MAKRPCEASPSKLVAWCEEAMKTPEKRPPKIPACVTRASPTKTLDQPRKKSSTPIQTLIFYDFETTGLIERDHQKFICEAGKFATNSESYTNKLNELLMITNQNQYPKITEMSFISCPRQNFEILIDQFKKLDEAGIESLSTYVATNTHTRQINPSLTKSEWIEYEAKKLKFEKEGKDIIVHSQKSISEKNTFDKEWPGVCDFLKNCKKPAALIAHNAIKFDLRILYGELKRFNLLETHPIPDQVYFIDTYIGICHIEDNYLKEIQQVLNGIDFETYAKILEHLKKQWNEEIKQDEIAPEISAVEVEEEKEMEFDHPIRLIKRNDWSVAKKRRFSPNLFKKIEGSWKFNFKKEEGKYKVETLYKQCVKGNFVPHFAQQDAEALMLISLTYGLQFLEYVDNQSAVIPF